MLQKQEEQQVQQQQQFAKLLEALEQENSYLRELQVSRCSRTRFRTIRHV
jgi:hypothetical protein